MVRRAAEMQFVGCGAGVHGGWVMHGARRAWMSHARAPADGRGMDAHFLRVALAAVPEHVEELRVL